MVAPAKLIDLSVAMDAPAAAALDHPNGTDEYMAPEQCEPGARGVVGPASDVWAFGATMFRAAAGYRAFDREPRWAQLRDEPLPLPSTVPPAFAAVQVGRASGRGSGARHGGGEEGRRAR